MSTVTGTPLDTQRQRRRQILDAAARVFARQGAAAARIHDVAREAGVAYGLVYHYFGSRNALLATVFDASWEAFADAVEGIVASPRAPRDRVRAILDYLFGAWEAHPDVVKVVVLEYGPRIRTGDLGDHPHVGRAIRAITRLFEDAAASLRPGLAPALMPAVFMGALEGAFSHAVATGASDTLPELRATLRALLIDSIFLPAPSTRSEAPCTST